MKANIASRVPPLPGLSRGADTGADFGGAGGSWAPLRQRRQAQLADVDLRLLRVFRAVVEQGGLAAAELRLNMALSTISRHMRDLETRLGLPLCQRGRAGFALTAEGTRVYAATLALLSATEAFRHDIDDLHAPLGGDLHIALFEHTVTNPQARIAEAIARFCVLAPAARLHLHHGSIGVMERGLAEGAYHLGIFPEHYRSPSLCYQPLFEESMPLYAGRGHAWFNDPPAPVGWDPLRLQALATLRDHSPNLELSQRHGLQRKATASDQEGVATLILSGKFLGFLPDHYAAGFVRQGLMRAVAPDVLAYQCQFSVVTQESPQIRRLTAAFVQTLREIHRASGGASQEPTGLSLRRDIPREPG